MKKKLKGLISLYLAAAMLISIALPATAADTPHKHAICGSSCTHLEQASPIHSELEFTGKIANAADLKAAALAGGKYYLTADIELTSGDRDIAVSENMDLCLNGHKIYYDKTLDSNDDSVFKVSGEKTFVVTDCSTAVTHGYIDDEYYWCAGESVPSGNTEYDLTGGVIRSEAVYAVNLSQGAIFHIYGGNLVGGANDLSSYYYIDDNMGVYFDDAATFHMYGGKIAGFGGYYGKGVEANGGTVRISAGEIAECDRAISNNGTVHISGGKVSACRTGIDNGGTLYIESEVTADAIGISNSGTLYIDGGEVTADSYAIRHDAGSFTYRGGTISGTLSFSGGAYMTVAKAFENTSPIPVNAEMGRIFAKPDGALLTDLTPYADKFIPENSEYYVVAKNKNLIISDDYIIAQPSASTGYKITATGAESDKEYTWYKVGATKTYTVTDAEATSTTLKAIPNYSAEYKQGKWWSSSMGSGGVEYFSGLSLEKHDVVKINIPDEEEKIYTLEIYDGDNGISYSKPNESGEDKDYEFLIKEDSTNCFASVHTPNFASYPYPTMAVTVERTEYTKLDGQTGDTLNTTNLENGTYVCEVAYGPGDDSFLLSDKFTYSGNTSPAPGPGGGGTVTRYSVEFETNGGSYVESKTVRHGKPVPRPEDPEKAGYVFDGWYSDKALKNTYDFSTQVSDNMVLYAKWSVGSQSGNSAPSSSSSSSSGGCPSGSDCPSKAYNDLDTDAWYHLDTDYVLDGGIMNGVGKKTFSPAGLLTRAMFVTILYRVEGEPAVNDDKAFADVKEDSWYENAVAWASEKGIVNGYGNNLFKPELSITREQIATMIYRYAQYKGYDVSAASATNISSYTDASQISSYAVDAMKYAVGEKLINGRSAATLNPKDTATRVEIAAIIHRFEQKYKR